MEQHPNADKLKVARVDVGEKELLQIVCGGTNLEQGHTVALALVGSVLAGNLKIEPVSIRGVESRGMICALEELHLGKGGPKEIMVLDTKAKPGTPLADALNLKGHSPEELGSLLTLRTAEVEGVERLAGDIVFEIDNKSLTHRPDLWGHYGMAREFAAFLKKKLKPYKPTVSFPKKGEQIKVVVQDKSIIRRSSFVIMQGIRVEESPQWIKTRLQSAGVRPVNNIVDVTNYVMLELGQPMHAYDRHVVKTDKIVLRRAHDGEAIKAIDHKTYTLTAEDSIITNGEKPLLITGIMGGADSEISRKTNEIILEAGSWDPVRVRKTSVRIGLRSDSSQRFEKSLDPEMTGVAVARAVEIILKICPSARIAGPMTDVRTYKKLKLPRILVDLEKVSRMIGVEISADRATRHLASLGFTVKQKGVSKKLEVTVPSHRATKDIGIEADLVEEIARMYGYENLPSPRFTLNFPKKIKNAH